MNNKEKYQFTKLGFAQSPDSNFTMPSHMRSFSPLQAHPDAAGRKSDGGSALATAGSMLGTGLSFANKGLGFMGGAAKSLAKGLGAGAQDGREFAAEGKQKYQQPPVDEYTRRTNSPEHQRAIQAQNTPGTPSHKASQDKINKSRGNLKSIPNIGATSYPMSSGSQDYLKNIRGIGGMFMGGR